MTDESDGTPAPIEAGPGDGPESLGLGGRPEPRPTESGAPAGGSRRRRAAGPLSARGTVARAKARRAGGPATWLVIGVPAIAVVAALLVTRSGEVLSGGPRAAPSARATELERPPARRRDTPLVGVAKEVIQASSYTYVLVATDDEGEQWAAVNRSELAKGDAVSIDQAILMERFESKALSRTFDRIWFGILQTRGIEEGEAPPGYVAGGAAADPTGSAGGLGGPAASASAAPVDATALLSPADVLSASKALAGKKIRVAGEVTKVNEAILDRNWIHLSGGAKDGGKNDLLVTSKALPKVGELVTLTGTVALEKDFGGGYRYAVVVEDAELVKTKL